MKTLISSIFCIVFLAGSAAFAQKADTLKTQQDTTKANKDTLKVPAKKPDYFSKYKKPATSTGKPQVNDTWNTKKEEKKVESNYKYENGRVTGGETKLKLGKKKQ